MDLRVRFLVLVLGIVLLPVLTIGLFISKSQSLPGILSDPLYDARLRSSLILQTQVWNIIHRQNLNELDIVAAPGGVVVSDATGRIIHASPYLGIKDNAGFSNWKVRNDFSIQTFRLLIDGQIWQIWLFLPPLDTNQLSLNFVFLIPAIPLVVMLAFTLAMSLLILRGINRSIKQLDIATKEIANGNLDFSLKTTGKDSLASLARSMDSMRQRLKEEYARRDRFIMAVSHDLKTPLAVIDGYLDAFDAGLADSSKKQTEFLDIIRNKTAVLSHRIAHLIELLRMSTLEWRHTLIQTDLTAWLIETLHNFREEAAIRDKNLEIRLDLPDPSPIAMNPDMVHRLLENLLDNAWAYASPDTSVTVSAGKRPECIYISVNNSGAGLSSAQLQLIFEPFYRGDHGRNTAGFGLGLASVKSIVEMHGWSISVDSVPGKTTEFTIQIPLLADKSPLSEHS